MRGFAEALCDKFCGPWSTILFHLFFSGYLFTNDGSYLSQHGSMIPIKEKASQGMFFLSPAAVKWCDVGTAAGSLLTDGGGSAEGESNGPQRAAANAPQNVPPSGYENV